MESTCDKGRMAESMTSDLALAAPTTLVTVYNSWGEYYVTTLVTVYNSWEEYYVTTEP